MKKALLCLGFILVVMACSLIYAAPTVSNYVMEVNYDTDLQISSYGPTTTNMPYYTEVYDERTETSEKRYKIWCTEIQSTNAVADLPAGVKDHWKAIATDDASDIDKKVRKLMKALALVQWEELNVVRTNASLPSLSKSYLKTRVKDEYNSMP